MYLCLSAAQSRIESSYATLRRSLGKSLVLNHQLLLLFGRPPSKAAAVFAKADRACSGSLANSFIAYDRAHGLVSVAKAALPLNPDVAHLGRGREASNESIHK